MLVKYLLPIVFIVLAVLILFAYKAKQSQKSDLYQNKLGLNSNNTKLKPCGDKPNCVCSEYVESEDHFVSPLSYKSDSALVLKQVENKIKEIGGEVTNSENNYLSAVFKSRFFGFIDDLEMRIDEKSKTLHFRSASREGHSDLGVNAKRVALLKSLLDL